MHIPLKKPLDNWNKGKDPVIHSQNIGVKYLVGRKRDDFRSLAQKLLSPGRSKIQEFWALTDISFSGFPGDIIGIIGANGAGKTTLCRVISGLLKPNTGEITVHGNISALLSLGTGFKKELTGKENIYLNGMMLGFSKKEMDAICEEVVSFSGLGEFIEHPIKVYSSGMKARLGFSIAAMLEPEILVLDEALSTGDLEFRERAAVRMKELVKKAKIVLIVSHDIDFVEKNCNRAIWIDKGKLQADGDSKTVCAMYRLMVEQQGLTKKRRMPNLKKTKSGAGFDTVIEASGLGLSYNLDGKTFWALQNINFSVKEGEIVGIIGPNGAGKTTLCRVVSGILKPDSGSVLVNGEIATLLSFGTGFNKQLSGMDNIILNGLMLGIPKADIQRLLNEIIEFSELGQFMHNPVKNYSSGMLSRLGFSIASVIEPDIFIIDEALSAGDMAFYEKASARIQEMINSSKAVIVVTHSMHFITKICTRAIWLKNGRIQYDGDPKEAVKRYREDIHKK